MKRLLAATAVVLLSACVMVPRTVSRYDADCRQVARHMELQAVQVGAIHACGHRGCEALLVAAGVTAAASTVISGSIVIVGNVVYWLERQGACTMAPRPAGVPPGLPTSSGPAAPSPVPAPSPSPAAAATPPG